MESFLGVSHVATQRSKKLPLPIPCANMCVEEVQLGAGVFCGWSLDRACVDKYYPGSK